jgi:hypothetical protein
MTSEVKGSLADNFLGAVSLLLARMLRLNDENTTLELARGEWQFRVAGRRITIIVVLLGPARAPPLALLSTLCWRRIWRTEERNCGCENP